MKKTLLFVLCALILCSLLPATVSAAGTTVVFVKDGGTGDGSSAEKALGTIQDAYAALDLTKDCTIVVCGPLTQSATFSYGKPYTGSVLITSVYNGTDYVTTSGAEYKSGAFRYVLWGTTTFDNITLHLNKAYFFIVAQCNPITIGANVKTVFDDATTNGQSFAKAISILGGFQNGQDTPELDCKKDVNITVLSGENIAIGAYNRQLENGNHSGAATITIGGTAKVGSLYTTSVNKPNTKNGAVTITVKDNASVQYLTADPDQSGVTLESLTVYYEGGRIEAASTRDATANPTLVANNLAPANTTTITKGAVLYYTAKTAASDTFAQVKSTFDSVISLDPSAPKTGDTSAVILACAAMLSGAALFFMRRRVR